MKMNEKEIEKYKQKCKLTEHEYQGYLKAAIEKFAKGKKKSNNPIAIYVAGQTGAGKSNLVKLINQRIGGKDNAVIYDFDIIKTMHPKYSDIRTITQTVHDILMPDAGRIVDDLREYCREERLNIINDGTMKWYPASIESLGNFKRAGYYVELDILSVPKLESYGSTLWRYAEALQTDNLPRFVSRKIHDESYDGLLVTLDELTKRNLYDKANVYRRGIDGEGDMPIKIYSTNEHQFHSALEAVSWGRKQYKQMAVDKFPQMYRKVESIFKIKAPDKVNLLEDWKLLYQEEKTLLSTTRDCERN